MEKRIDPDNVLEVGYDEVAAAPFTDFSELATSFGRLGFLHMWES